MVQQAIQARGGTGHLGHPDLILGPCQIATTIDRHLPQIGVPRLVRLILVGRHRRCLSRGQGLLSRQQVLLPGGLNLLRAPLANDLSQLLLQRLSLPVDRGLRLGAGGAGRQSAILPDNSPQGRG